MPCGDIPSMSNGQRENNERDNKQEKVLIVGVNSQIGNALKNYLTTKNITVFGTTRQKEHTNPNTYYFDLEKPNLEIFTNKFSSVVVCASTNNIAECEKEPQKHRIINVTNTIKLIEHLVQNNSFVIYLSSTTVFNGQKSFCEYNDKTCPRTLFGKFKTEVEEYLTTKLGHKSCILRLTKVITKNTPFIKHWENEANAGKSIKTLTNMFFSPVDIENVVNSIELLITQKQNGIYQLGGSEEMSYTDYAKKYFQNNTSALKLITPVDEDTNHKISYNSLKTYLPNSGEKYLDSSIIFSEHKDKDLINEIQKDILKYFNEDEKFYFNLPIEIYRELVKNTQDLLNEKEYARKICEKCIQTIKNYIKEDKFFIQTNLYLRATRPTADKETESIGWHRETFYGPNMEKSVNIWTPILGVNEKNTLRFIPNSHNISESDIIVNQINDEATIKGSTGQKIGFLYSPKIIVGGVDWNKATAMNVPNFNSALFPGLLIHGSAQNFSQNIRFSVDFRILPFSAYDPEQAKKNHFASDKPYFELY